MPGNDVGDRLHNFFVQDNLTQDQQCEQLVEGNWPVLNNDLWAGNERQVGLFSSKKYNTQEPDAQRGQGHQFSASPYGFDVAPSNPRQESAKSQPEIQLLNLNGFTTPEVVHMRQNEANFLGVDAEPDRHNLTSRGLPILESQQWGGFQHNIPNSMSLGSAESNMNFHFLGSQQHMSDARLLQQHIMANQMQELQRQRQFKQMEAMQRNMVNQMSPFPDPVSGHQSPTLINGTPMFDSCNNQWSSQVMGGNTHMMQREASAPMQGFYNGLNISPQQGQALHLMGLIPHQAPPNSLYGVPISGAQSERPLSHSNINKPGMSQVPVRSSSFSGNQYAPEQMSIEEASTLPRFGTEGKSSLENTTKGSVNVVNLGGLHQVQQGNVPASQSERHNVVGCENTVSQAASSQSGVALDPTEQRILFGDDESIWEAFTGASITGTADSNRADGTDSFGFPPVQSGRWSALMQSAVAEASGSDTGVQEEPSAVGARNSGSLTTNKQQGVWVDSSQRASSGSGAFPREANWGSDGVNASSNPFLNRQRESLHVGSNAEMRSPLVKNDDGAASTSKDSFDFWKPVSSSANDGVPSSGKNQPHLDTNPPFFMSPRNMWDSGATDTQEPENGNKKENSTESYRSSFSQHASPAGDSHSQPGAKQKSPVQVDGKFSAPRKFKYHPMGDIDADEKSSYGATRIMHLQTMSQHSPAGIKGLADSSNLEKFHASDFQGGMKLSHWTSSSGMNPDHMPNSSAFPGRYRETSSQDKLPSSSQNMLELINKVDRSKEHTAVLHSTSSDGNRSSGGCEGEASDGSVSLNRNASSTSRGFHLQLAPPSQGLPATNFSVPSQTSSPNVGSPNSSHIASDKGEKAHSSLGSAPQQTQVDLRNNMSGIPGHTSIGSNFSAPVAPYNPFMRSPLQNQHMPSEDGNIINNKPIDDPRDKFLAEQSGGRFAMHQMQGFLASSMAGPSNKDNLPDASLDNAVTQKDIEAFHSKPNHDSRQSYSLLHQMQATRSPPIDPCDRESKRFKGLENTPDAQPVAGSSGQPVSVGLNDSFRDASMSRTSVLPSFLPQTGNDWDKEKSFQPLHGNPPSQDMRVFGQDDPSSGTYASRIGHTGISAQMAPSWFEQYGAFKSRQLLPAHDVQRTSISKNMDQPYISGMPSDSLALNNVDQVNAITSASHAANIRQVTSVPLLNELSPSTHTLVPPVAVPPYLSSLGPKKRKIATSDHLPWRKEVEQNMDRLLNISSAEAEWAQAANFLIEKVGDETNANEDMVPYTRSKRRLILTTRLMQRVFRPPPAVVLSLDASSAYEATAYSIARKALGDACSFVCPFETGSSASPDTGNIPLEKSKTSQRIKHQYFSQVTESFIVRAKNLEHDLSRLDRQTSISDLRLECQDLERFSIINHFAKFHGRAHVDGSHTSSASTSHRAVPQRYVSAFPMPGNVPVGVQCLSL